MSDSSSKLSYSVPTCRAHVHAGTRTVQHMSRHNLALQAKHQAAVKLQPSNAQLAPMKLQQTSVLHVQQVLSLRSRVLPHVRHALVGNTLQQWGLRLRKCASLALLVPMLQSRAGALSGHVPRVPKGFSRLPLEPRPTRIVPLPAR